MQAPVSPDPNSNKRPQDLAQPEDSLKKAKVEGVSRTLHVRALPMDCTEQDLIAISCAFGKVENVLLMRGKNQGFIQFEDPAMSMALISYYSGVQASIKGKHVFFQYSNKDTITSQPQHETPNHILLVTIQNMIYPVTIEILHTVFSKYGAVRRLNMFNKNGANQALIEYADVQSAVAAKSQLEGQCIYQGACMLRIVYSQLDKLTVKSNNDKTRDFENPNLPTTPSQPPGGAYPYQNPAAAYHLPPPQGAADPYAVYKNQANQMAAAAQAAIAGGCCVFVSGLNAQRVTPDVLFVLFGVYGDVLRVKILPKKPDTALIQFTSHEQAQAAASFLQNCPLYGSVISVNMSHHSTIAPAGPNENNQLTKDYSNSPAHRYRSVDSKHLLHRTSPSAMLHIAGLPANATEEDVTSMFARFGNVVGFKFFAKDRRMGLLQMGSVPEGVEALIGAHQQVLLGSVLRVSFSKSSAITAPQ
jgi:RNA recognition motif-containing protein